MATTQLNFFNLPDYITCFFVAHRSKNAVYTRFMINRVPYGAFGYHIGIKTVCCYVILTIFILYEFNSLKSANPQKSATFYCTFE